MLEIKLSPELVDVNVHPAKTEVKFAYEKEVYDTVFYAVKGALFGEEKKEEQIKSDFVPQSFLKAESFEKKPQAVQLSMNFLKKEEKKEAEQQSCERGKISFKERGERERISPDFTEKFIEYTKPPADYKGGSETFFEPEKQKEDFENKTDETFAVEIKEKSEDKIIIGQLFDTYVIFQQGDSMFLADQHAVHERVRFERLLEQKHKNQSFSQVMLDPIVLDLDPGERMILQDNLEFFEEYGFDITDFGGGSYIIQKTPVITSEKEIKNLVFEILGILKSGRSGGILSVEERTLDSIACKYAVKANKKLSAAEMEKVVLDLENLEKKGITTCPHGRPLLGEYKKYDLEKLFKRIV